MYTIYASSLLITSYSLCFHCYYSSSVVLGGFGISTQLFCVTCKEVCIPVSLISLKGNVTRTKLRCLKRGRTEKQQ